MSVKYMVEGKKMCSSSKNALQKQKIRGRNHKIAWQNSKNVWQKPKKCVAETSNLRGRARGRESCLVSLAMSGQA